MGLSIAGNHFTGPENAGYVNEKLRHNSHRIF